MSFSIRNKTGGIVPIAGGRSLQPYENRTGISQLGAEDIVAHDAGVISISPAPLSDADTISMNAITYNGGGTANSTVGAITADNTAKHAIATIFRELALGRADLLKINAEIQSLRAAPRI